MTKNSASIDAISARLSAYISGGYEMSGAFFLAEAYFDEGQWTSAASFYQKVTDMCKSITQAGGSLSDDEAEMEYSSYLLYSVCLKNLRNREMGEETFCNYAISVDPARPEGYVRMCEVYDSRRLEKRYHAGFEFESINWFRLLGYASAGEMTAAGNGDIGAAYRVHLSEYEDMRKLTAYKCIAQYMLEDYKTARLTYIGIERSGGVPAYLQKELDDLYMKYTSPLRTNAYRMNRQLHFKYPFWMFESIRKNASYNMADMFILSITNGRMDGSYVDAYPAFGADGSNVRMLSGDDWRWKGVSISTRKSIRKEMSSAGMRVIDVAPDDLDINIVISATAKNGHLDYLGIGDASLSLDILKRVKFGSIGIGIITAPHMADDKESEAKIRDILLSNGFYIVARNMETATAGVVEDWAANTDLIDNSYILKMKSDSSENKVDDYFYRKEEYEKPE